MKTLTVKDLQSWCNSAVKQGFGKRKIVITNDDECNGVHELFNGFSLLQAEDARCLFLPHGVTASELEKDYIMLG